MKSEVVPFCTIFRCLKRKKPFLALRKRKMILYNIWKLPLQMLFSMPGCTYAVGDLDCELRWGKP
jgi:hypothetical protein